MHVNLDSNASQHICAVLRLKTGAPLLIFNGQGGQYQAKIIAINKINVTVQIATKQACNTESSLKIHLGQVISRGQKMDYTIQKAVELGVSEITPLFSERCGVKLDESRQQKRCQHWQQIAIHAAEQSGRERVPIVHPPIDIKIWIKQPSAPNSRDLYRVILDPNGAPLKREPNHQHPDSTLKLLIGPEGGFTPAEIQFAEKNAFQPTSLGPRILRTETAAVAVISIFQYISGYE